MIILATTKAVTNNSIDWSKLIDYINDHSYLVELVVGIITIFLIILFGLLTFYKEELKLHAKNKKQARKDKKRIKELELVKSNLIHFENYFNHDTGDSDLRCNSPLLKKDNKVIDNESKKDTK